jgi:hypothetical protein
MIIFLVERDHAQTLRAVARSRLAGNVKVHSFEWALQQKRLPRATYVFTDMERMDVWQQTVLAKLFIHIQQAGPGYRALNNPAAIGDRGALLRKLHDEGLNDFNAYRVTENRWPERYPVFVRRMSMHTKPVTPLLPTQQALQDALGELMQSGEAQSDLLIIEYCAQPVAENLYRKLSSFKIGEVVFFIHTVHDIKWLVKHGRKNSATPELYQDEHDMILENRFSEHLSRVFDIAGVEYGRVDFGMVNGRVQVYEINTNPFVSRPLHHPNPVRVRSARLGWETYLESLAKIDTTDSRAPLASQFEHPQLLRKWRGIQIKRP